MHVKKLFGSLFATGIFKTMTYLGVPGKVISTKIILVIGRFEGAKGRTAPILLFILYKGISFLL